MSDEMKSDALISPHGGHLIDLSVQKSARPEMLERARSLAFVDLSSRALADLECLSTGVYSPLTGFMGATVYEQVIAEMRLPDGVVWPIPVTLTVSDEVASTVDAGNEVALKWEGKIVALLQVEDVYRPDKARESVLLF